MTSRADVILDRIGEMSIEENISIAAYINNDIAMAGQDKVKELLSEMKALDDTAAGEFIAVVEASDS